MSVKRRKFLSLIGRIAAAAALPSSVWAMVPGAAEDPENAGVSSKAIPLYKNPHATIDARVSLSIFWA